MKKKYFALMVTFCTVSFSYSQNDLEKENLKGHVHSEEISVYDGVIKFGDPTKTNLKIKGKNYYDENGMLFMVIIKEGKGIAKGTTVYDYENLTELIATKSYSTDGDLLFNTEYIYDNQRNLTEINKYRKGRLFEKEKRVYINSSIYESSIYTSKGELSSCKRVELDALGRILKETDETRTAIMAYGNDGKLLKETIITNLNTGNGIAGSKQETTYNYNEHGDLYSLTGKEKANVSTTSNHEDLENTYSWDSQYKYDSKGNWISQTEKYISNTLIGRRIQKEETIAFKEKEIKYAKSKEELSSLKKQIVDELNKAFLEKKEKLEAEEQQKNQKAEKEIRKKKFETDLESWINKQRENQEVEFRLKSAKTFTVDASERHYLQQQMSFSAGVFRNIKTGDSWEVDQYKQYGSDWIFISKDKQYAACYYPKENKLYFVYTKYNEPPKIDINISLQELYNDMEKKYTDSEIQEFTGYNKGETTIFKGSNSRHSQNEVYKIFPAEALFSAPQIKKALRKWVEKKGGKIEK